MKRTSLFTWFWAVALSLNVAAASLEDYRPPEKGSVRIVRDSYGVPHIIARDERSLFYGAGYAQAEDQLENLMKNYLRAQGRSARQYPNDHSQGVPRSGNPEDNRGASVGDAPRRKPALA